MVRRSCGYADFTTFVKEFTLPLTLARWARFEKIASRVRRLRVEEEIFHDSVGSSLAFAMLNFGMACRTALLPRLQAVTWGARIERLPSLVALILSSELQAKEVHLSNDVAEDLVGDWLLLLQRRIPNSVVSLNFQLDGRSLTGHEDRVSVISNIVQQSTHLKQLILPTVYPYDFDIVHPKPAPGIKSVTLCFDSDDAPLSPVSFTSKIVEKFPCLTRVSIAAYGTASWDWQALSKLTTLRTIVDIELTNFEIDEEPIPNHSSTPNLSLAELRSLGSALPQLRSLSFSHCQQPISILLELGQKFPLLRYLCLRFVDWDVPKGSPVTVLPSLEILSFNVEEIPQISVPRVASLIARLCPSGVDVAKSRWDTLTLGHFLDVIGERSNGTEGELSRVLGAIYEALGPRWYVSRCFI